MDSLKLGKIMIIFTHNLGAFDGYFILPSLYSICENPRDVNLLIDDKSKFITISYSFKRSEVDYQ